MVGREALQGAAQGDLTAGEGAQREGAGRGQALQLQDRLVLLSVETGEGVRVSGEGGRVNGEGVRASHWEGQSQRGESESGESELESESAGSITVSGESHS